MTDADPSQDGRQPNDRCGRAAIEWLIENDWLCLRSDDRIIRTFHALVRVGLSVSTGKTDATNYLVYRADERIIITSLSDDVEEYEVFGYDNY